MSQTRIKVRFRVLYRPSCQGEQPAVIGSIPALGKWDFDRGNNLHQRARCLPLVSGSGFQKIWETVMDVSSNTEFDWNWVILNSNDKIIQRESKTRTLKVDTNSLILHSQWDESCQVVKKNVCRIDLRATYLTHPEVILGICGSAPSLGNWDPKCCVLMDRCYPRDSGKWRASFKISNEIETEWKLVVVHKATKQLIRWEERSNRSLLTSSQWLKLEAIWSGSDTVSDTMSLSFDEHFNTVKLLEKQRGLQDASGASSMSTAQPQRSTAQNSYDQPEPAEASPSSYNPVSTDTGNATSPLEIDSCNATSSLVMDTGNVISSLVMDTGNVTSSLVMDTDNVTLSLVMDTGNVASSLVMDTGNVTTPPVMDSCNATASLIMDTSNVTSSLVMDTGNVTSSEPDGDTKMDIGTGSASGCSESSGSCMVVSVSEQKLKELASNGIDDVHKEVLVKPTEMLRKDGVSELKLVDESFLIDRTRELESLGSMVEYEARLDSILGLSEDTPDDKSSKGIQKYLPKDYVSLNDRFDHGAEFRPTSMKGQIPCHLTFNSKSEVVNCVIQNEEKEPDCKLIQVEGFGDSAALGKEEVVVRPEMNNGDVLQPSRDVAPRGNQTSRLFLFENRNEAFGLLGYHKKYTFFPAFVIFLKVINEYYWQAK